MATEMSVQIQNENTATLACTVELGSQVLLNVAGNEISNFVGGQEVTLPLIQSALLARLKAHLAPPAILAAGE